MNAEVIPWYVAGDFGNDFRDLGGESAAVGIAENNPARAGLVSSPDTAQCKFGIGFVAVKKMLGVKDNLFCLPVGMDN